MDNKELINEAIVTPELYFLISKFLAAGPLQETAKVLVRELEEKKVLPRRTDWLGVEHEQSFNELEQKYAHIGANHLLEICCRIGPILDRELAPSVPGIISLLGTGRQSLLRTKESIYRPRSLLDYCSRIHGVSLPDSSVTKPIHNFQKVIIGREYGGPIRRKLLVPTSLYSKAKLLRRTVGHLSSVYCVLFDRTGRYIITGADDLLIKIWSAIDGRLLATLRGASAEITDIAINLDNTMLAAGCLDRILRVWDMQTTSPIAVLSGHTGMITSVNFCPSPRSDLKYLVTTSTDGSIAFWQYSTPRGQKITFAPKPIQYHEKLRPGQAQMMCTTFSPGGMFLAAGSADHHVRVYIMSEDGPKRILETEAYTDAVDSVQWSHRGLRFISGSKDGTAHIWTFESQQWKSMKLCMTERLATCPEPEEGKKLKVTMVAWDCSDKYVITAANDFTIKIWHAKSAKLHCVLRGHKDELYVLESNPKDEHVLLSAGHDGQVFLWDIEEGVSVAHFINNIDGQGHGGVFDAKWSPDGTMIAATDSHGHILIFGLGIGPDKYKMLPTELFFHTDYRPVLRDASHYVVDEQTQVMPHLMPPPFLVDADGNPHPAKYQRYVPGREACTTDQLVPNLTIGADGVVVEDSVAAQNAATNYSHIDRLIAALANRQGGASAGSPGQDRNVNGSHSQLDRMIEAFVNRQGQDQAPDSNNRQSGSRASSSAGNVLGNGPSTSRNASDSTVRRLSDASVPRQGTTWGRPVEQSQQAPLTPLKYIRRIYVRPMKYAQLQNLKQTVYAAGQFEMQEYKREMRRRPIMINTASAITSSQVGSGRSRGTRGANSRTVRRRGPQGSQQQQQPAYRTRAVRDQEEVVPRPEEEEEEEESSASSGDTSYSNVEDQLDESSSDSDTDSSDYSDWVADKPGPNLEPPKRSKRKPLSRRRTLSDDSSDETTTQAGNSTGTAPTTSAAAAAENATTSKSLKRNKKIIIPPPAPNGEIPELYRPAEWLSEVIPRKAPYYPQMGDEIVYFRQGHHRYLEAVRLKKVYKLSHSSEPWNFRTLRDHELVRVIGIKYEIRPPRLCCLKLAMIDEDGNMTGTSFKIKYHDMPDVLDFLVLRQTFDLAVQRNWSLGDRFRCMILDGWWMGQIESRHALSADFPDSFFMCFRVRWDNGEYEYMSPWDMEPIDENRLPDEVGGAVPVLAEEIRATLYQPKSEEWHRGDRDGSCRRIINGLEQLMRLSIAEHFLAPVDLNIYPDYAYLIEYPIDLTTVKSRFENHFYRRITSAQFDVRYLATNAEKYNRSHTSIVKHARIITDLCLRIIREPNDIDVAAVYHQLVDVYHSSESENDNESDVVPSTSTGPSTSAAAAAARQTISSSRRSKRIRSDGDWRVDCRQLLDLMWQRPDSAAFREPVDTIEFPDYLEIISTPMDLRTVKEDLLGGNYDDPLDFAKDVRLIFTNSKNYNTNKRSRIYSMTLRLSALFESHIKNVISNWKSARRRANKNKTSPRGSSGSPSKRLPNDRNHRSGPSTRRNQKSNTRRLHSSDEDDDDDDDDDEVNGRNYVRRSGDRTKRVGIRNGNTRAAVASTSNTNRVTSSSSHRDETTQPTRSSRRQAASRAASQELHEDDDEDADLEVNASEAHSSSMSSDDDDEDDDSSEQATSEAGSDAHADNNSGGRRRKRTTRGGAEDSEESYNPEQDRNDSRGRKRKRSNKKSKQRKAKKIRRFVPPSDDDDQDFDQHDNSSNSRSARRAGGSSKSRNHSNTSNKKSRTTSGRRRQRLHTSEEETAGTAAHVDDSSTQDNVSNTPKKKGRPAKVQSNLADRPSTSSAAAMEQLLVSPSRNTRNQVINNRRIVAETDHSYHLPVRNGARIAESDTDSREAAAAVRPTRASVKRAILNWARGSDIEEEVEEEVEEEPMSEEAEEILPTPTPTKVNGHHGNTSRDLNGPSTSRSTTTAGVVRQLRTNRNTVVVPEVEDEDDGSDNEPLASSQGSLSRFNTNHLPSTRITRTHLPQLPQRRPPLQQPHAIAISVSAHHMTRSHATSSTPTVATSSVALRSTHPAQVDHNYVGDPAGPSTSTAEVRNLRRVLSRHQRNADELDDSSEQLESSRHVFGISSRLRRGLPTSTSSSLQQSEVTAPTIHTSSDNSTTTTTARRGRSRYSQENTTEPEANDDDDDDDEDAGGSDEGTDGGSSDQSDNDVTDSEDNQPLTSYRPATTVVRNTRATNLGSSQTRQRTVRGSGTEDSFICDDDDDEDYRVGGHRRRRRKHSNSKSLLSRSKNNINRLRGTRNQKRPRYNEQSEDDGSNDQLLRRKQRKKDVVDTVVVSNNEDNFVGSTATVATSQLPSTSSSSRNPPIQALTQAENHAANEDEMGGSTADSDNEQLVSVSSRGRVRKITAKARSIFKE